jgi:hypothetical protein
MTAGATSAVIEWGWAGVGLERPSGDLHVIVTFEGGALVGLIDGLGHGPEAAAASSAAAETLEAFPRETVMELVKRCHARLRTTRGAVMTLASFDAGAARVTWTGVGNVDGVVLRARSVNGRDSEAVSPRPGVVGGHLPPLSAAALPIAGGDLLVMATDGVRSGFIQAVRREHTPQQIAESILVHYGRGTDDAHVVVARYLGDGP